MNSNKFITKFKYVLTDNHSYKVLAKEANKLYNENINLKNYIKILQNENDKLKSIINQNKNNNKNNHND
jgi:hypothetical protein